MGEYHRPPSMKMTIPATRTASQLIGGKCIQDPSVDWRSPANLRSLGDSCSGGDEPDGRLGGVIRCIHGGVVSGNCDSGDAELARNLGKRVLDIFERQPVGKRVRVGGS